MSKNEKSGFLLYKEQYDGVSLLSMKERGELLTAIYEYQINGNVSTDLSASASMAFQFIKGQFERDTQKYNEMCATLRENGKLGGRPRKNQTEPKVFVETKRFLGKPKNLDTVTDTDTVTVTVTDYKTTTTTITPPISPSSEGDSKTPSVEVMYTDVAEYFIRNKFVSSSENFYTYNQRRGWRGIGGKDISDEWEHYANMWELEERRKRGENITLEDIYESQRLR